MDMYLKPSLILLDNQKHTFKCVRFVNFGKVVLKNIVEEVHTAVNM
jgi:hypothetical protein